MSSLKKLKESYEILKLGYGDTVETLLVMVYKWFKLFHNDCETVKTVEI